MFTFAYSERHYTVMIANKILVGALVLYGVTIFLSIFKLPGTLELAIFSIPTVSLLLFRFYRINLLGEKNIWLKFFAVIMSIFISISLLIPVLTIKDNSLTGISTFLVMSWMMLILLNNIYYTYYLIYAREKNLKTGYLILILSGLIFLVGTGISHYLNDDYIELKYITSFSLSLLAMYLFFQFVRKQAMPHVEIGSSLMVGATFIFMVEIILLFFK